MSGRRTRSLGSEQGAVAIIMALSMVALCVVGGMVVDLGLLRVDRQSDKAAADAAALAGVNGLVPDISTPTIHPFAGVCQALHYLQANDPDFETPSSPTWYKGDGSPLGADGCSPSFASAVCTPGNASTWAKFTGVSSDGHTRVTIQSGYSLQNSGFSEDGDAVFNSDGDDPQQLGCDQLAVIMSVTRGTTLGSPAATTMGTTLRSVARLAIQSGDQAPALLLLEPNKCSVLVVGSSGGGSGSLIHVNSSGTTAGTIHADSDATGADCGSGSNQQLFQGHQSDAIVAYGAGGESGTITSVAGYQGKASNVVSDNSTTPPDMVYGTTASGAVGAGTKTGPTGRDRVTRAPVDSRYRDGVATAIRNNLSWINATSAPAGFANVNCTAAAINTAITNGSLNSTSSVYINCSGGYALGTGAAPITIPAQNIILDGYFKSGGIAMPNAQNVFLAGDTSQPAIKLTTGSAFCIRSNGTCTSATVNSCSSSPTGNYASHATLFIRNGSISQTGGTLRMCNTSVVVLGGQTTTATNLGCIPSTDGTAPSVTPCSLSGVNGGAGNGQLSIGGGGIQDWTAPNAKDVVPLADKPDAYSKYFEDLALWDESYGASTGSVVYTMAGGGNTHTQGVFMVPNAAFNISGGGAQNLVNAQYIARKVILTGGAQLTMTVDPNSAVTLPSVSFYMVR